MDFEAYGKLNVILLDKKCFVFKKGPTDCRAFQLPGSPLPGSRCRAHRLRIRRLDKEERGGSLQGTPTATDPLALALKARMFDESASKLQQRHASDRKLLQISSVIDPNTLTRDAAIRKSISEKRQLRMHTDPSHLETFQRIVHQHQFINYMVK